MRSFGGEVYNIITINLKNLQNQKKKKRQKRKKALTFKNAIRLVKERQKVLNDFKSKISLTGKQTPKKAVLWT